MEDRGTDDPRTAEEFGERMDEYRPKVLRVCRRIIYDSLLAEDAAQNTLFRAWLRFDQFQGRSSFLTWLTRIAMNECTMALRKLQKNRLEISLEELPSERFLRDPSRDALSLLVSKELVDTVNRTMSIMPERWRVVMTLCDIEEKSIAELVVILGSPEGTIKAQASRARQGFRQRFEGLGGRDNNVKTSARENY